VIILYSGLLLWPPSMPVKQQTANVQ